MVLSVVLEGRTQAQTARVYGVSKATVSRWVARYRAESLSVPLCKGGGLR